MDKRTAIETDLKAAQSELEALRADLPQFHALLTDNEVDAQRLKSERAPLDAQAQTKGRVDVAREMLEQHQSDIQNAQAEVARLEALEHREQLLEKMHTAADAAKAHREAMDQALERATRGLQKSCQTMLREWKAENEARQIFAAVGSELVPSFNSLSEPVYSGMTSEQRQRFEADRETLLDELLARGVPLDCATDGATGRHSSLDKDTKRELPRDQVSMLIWSALKLFAGPEGRMISRFLPAQASYDEMPDYLKPDEQHSL